MSNTILLDPFDEAEARLSGEMAIDDAVDVLAVGEDVVPLHVPLLPVATPNSRLVYLMGEDGPEVGPLKAGAGGQPLDGMDYCVPGLIPLSVSERLLEPASPLVSFMEVTEPLTIWSGRLRVISQTATVSVSIASVSGVPVWEPSTFINGAQVREIATETPLPAGRYRVTVSVSDPILLETIGGHADWSLNVQTHVFSLRVTA